MEVDWSAVDMRDVFFDRVYDMAVADSRVVFLSADHGALSLEKLARDFPQRYVNMGIAEQNMIGVAAGLALSGKLVYAYGIAPFVSLRVLEQISLSVAAMNLPVNIVSVGSGFTYSTDGPSHQGIQDLAAVLSVPHLTVLNSSDPMSTRAFAEMAVRDPGPKYIRIEKGKLPQLYPEETDFNLGFGVLAEGRDVTIVASGVMVHTALAAARHMATKGLSAGVIDLYRPKPLPVEALHVAMTYSVRVATLEEGVIINGMGNQVAAAMLEGGRYIPFKRLGIGDTFCCTYGERPWVQEQYGLSSLQVAEILENWINGHI